MLNLESMSINLFVQPRLVLNNVNEKKSIEREMDGIGHSVKGFGFKHSL